MPEIEPHCVVEVTSGMHYPKGDLLVPLEISSSYSTRQNAQYKQSVFTRYMHGKTAHIVLDGQIVKGPYSTVQSYSHMPDRDALFTGHVAVKYPRGQKFNVQKFRTGCSALWKEYWSKPQPAAYFDTRGGKIVGLFFSPKNSFFGLWGSQIINPLPDSQSNWPADLFACELSDLIAVDSVVTSTAPQCTCDTKTIFAKGCVCGFLKKRKFGI